MKNFLSKINLAIQRTMYGRYGMDELSRTASILSLILMVLSWMPRLHFLYFPAMLILLWIIFRCYSRNFYKRNAERSAYLHAEAKAKGWISFYKRKHAERNTHRYFRCKKCKTFIRTRKGRGKILLTCPKCGTESIRKT